MHASIRPAGVDDAAAINDIANWYIEHTAINFDASPWSLEKRQQWIKDFNQEHSSCHLFVAEMNNQISGFACNTQFRPKDAYRRSTETSVYVHPEMPHKRIGETLYRALLDRIAQSDLHRAFAIITLPNPASIRLHAKLGFSECGILSEAGWKFNSFHSISIYEKHLKHRP